MSGLLAPDSALAAGALPAGGQYVSGKGSIAGSGAALTVKQSSTTGIVDWSNFSIGKGNTVTFDNGSGATLNRVTGANISNIAGSLNATGSIYLMNPEGVVIGAGGKVVTGGDFAITTDIGNDKHGSIVDAGHITSRRGSVSLSGANVGVSGMIAVNRGGHIWLTSASTTSVSGSLSANNASGAGGSIVATGETVNVAGTANISASGKTGGAILIGGDVHGGAIAADNFVKQSVSDATTTTVGKGAKISADGSASAGGDIVVWSNGKTTYQGAISATGKTSGGFAEVSSHDVLTFTGTADLLAANGKTGTLLLDPENVTIETGSTTNGSLNGGSPTNTFTPSGDNSILSVSDLENALASANVDVTTGSSGSQTGDITVASPVTWSSGFVLTLDAFHSVYIDAPIRITSSGGLTIKTNDGGSSGVFAVSDGGQVNYGATNYNGTLTINGNPFTLIYSMSELQAINASYTSLEGNYALATPLNATSTTSWTPIGTDGNSNLLNSGAGFSGTFEGLGNTITGLTINIPSISYVGLFGYSTGTIRDIGMVGGSVSGGNFVGDLVGANYGTVSYSYAMGTVSSTEDYVGGLVGYADGTISNSYATGAVSGSADVGGLAGNGGGEIINDYATGAVSGPNYIGGLVGYNTSGEITDDYATGAVTGNFFVGGLVGYTSAGAITGAFATGTVAGSDYVGGLIGYSANGAITNAFATGAVGGTYWVGGLVGYNASGGITDAFATGAVAAGTKSYYVGGLVGDNDGGTVKTSYWDTQTTGQQTSSVGGAGMTTVQLQAALPSGFSSSNWGIIPGVTFPYLLWQVPSGTPQVVYGTIGGASSNANLTVDLLVNGTSVTPLVAIGSGANGYYYVLLAPNTIAATGSNVLAYISGGSVVANTLLGQVTGSVANVNLTANTLTAVDNSTTLSGIEADYASALGANTGAAFLGFTSNLTIDSSAAAFTFDKALSLTGTLDLDMGGTVGQSAGVITASTLTGSSAGGMTLYDANDIADIGSFTNSVSGSFALVDATSLTINGALGSTGDVALKTIGSGHTIGIDQAITAASEVILNSLSIIAESGSGAIDAPELVGSSAGGATLNDANDIAVLGSFTNSTSGSFALIDASSLTISGALGSAGDVALKTMGSGHKIGIGKAVTAAAEAILNSASTVTETSTGTIDASELVGSSAGGATLTGANDIGVLGSFANSTSGSFALTSVTSLAVENTLSSTGNVTLTTLGSGHSLAIDNTVTASNEAILNSASTIGENGSGAIDAHALFGSSSGATSLSGANGIVDLAAFSTSGGSFALVDDAALTTTGTVNVGTATLSLTTGGTNQNLAIVSQIEGGTVDLVTSGEATENTSTGVIDASTTLNVTANTGISLTSTSNNIQALGTDKTNSGPNNVHL